MPALLRRRPAPVPRRRPLRIAPASLPAVSLPAVSLPAVSLPVLSLLLAVLLVAAAAPLHAEAAAPSRDDEAAEAGSLRLGTAVAPEFQRVHLDLDPAKATYTGSVHVDLTVLRPTPSFRLHAEAMEITRLALTTDAGDAVAVAHRTLPGGRVEVSAGAPLAPGVYSLDVDFSNDFGTRAVGLYRAEHEGTPYLFTQFQAVDAREAFPVWDEPGFKLPYQLVLTVPDGNLAATNSPEVARHDLGAADRITFARTRPLPSYLLALAVGPFETTAIEGLGVPGRILAPKGLGHLAGTAAEMTPPLLAALEAWFGTPYPYAKLDLVAVPEFWPGAMENPGLITFADHILLLDPQATSASQLRNLARVGAHELAHMWFGDLVTMQWWDDLWLNESFADWMAVKIADQVYPQLEADLWMLRGVQGIFAVDARPTTEPIRRPVENAEGVLGTVGLAYAKGRAVLGMVESWLGEASFQAGVRAHVDRHADGNAVGADLWQALSEASDRDVSGVLASFLDQSGYPLISVEPVAGTAGAFTVSQRRFLNHGTEAPDQLWQVPVVLRYVAGGEVGSRAVLLSGASTRVELGAAVEWVMPDGGAHGYYRWRVPEPMMLAMANEAASRLEPEERIAFVANAAALLDAGHLGGDDYLRVLQAFAADPHPEVLAAVTAGLGKVEQAFVPDDLRLAFAAWVRRTLRPALERIGLDPQPGEPEAVALVRPQVLDWLGDEGRDPQVRSHGRRLAASYLEDPASVDPALVPVALTLAARDGDEALWETFRQRFETAPNPVDRERFLDVLGAFEAPALQERALAYVLEGPIRPTELFAIPGAISGPGGGDRTYAWFESRYAELAARMPPEFVAFLPGFAGGCSAERLARAKTFFGEPEHRVDGTEGQLAKVAQQVEDCLELRRREGAAVADYLRGDEGVGDGGDEAGSVRGGGSAGIGS